MNRSTFWLAMAASLSMTSAWASTPDTSGALSASSAQPSLKITTTLVPASTNTTAIDESQPEDNERPQSSEETQETDTPESTSTIPTLDEQSHALCVDALSQTPGLVLPDLTPTDQAILRLYQDSVRKRTPKDELLAQLAHTKDPLNGYIEYWPIYIAYAQKPQLPENRQAMEAFIASHPEGYLHERAIRDYLRIKPTLFEPKTYLKYYQQLVWNQDELDIKAWRYIYGLEAQNSPALRQEAEAFIRQEPLKGEALVALVIALTDRDPKLTIPLMSLVMQKGRWDSARQLSQKLMALPLTEKIRYQIITNPTAWIKKQKSFKDTPSVVLYWVGLRLARSQPAEAVAWTQTHSKRLNATERSHILTLAAYEAATGWKPEAVKWFHLSPKIAPPGLNQPSLVLAWRARSELMAKDWSGVLLTIASMDEAQQKEPAWQYWRARALDALHQPDKAKPHYEAIANDPHFYGLLAREALGLAPQALSTPEQPVTVDTKALEADPNFTRARRFYGLELYGLGHREWNWGLKQWPRETWPAIAQWAASQGLWHRSIQLAEKLDLNAPVLALRYPTPLEACVRAVAKAQGVSPAWLYGLIRQESRFMPSARSSTNAMGWMQVMPATGKLVARRAKIAGFHPDHLSDVAVNLQIGSLYLKGLHDALADQTSAHALALAGYNAGPGRVTQWRARMTTPLEGAVFIESIPFYETRDYVKNVLANLYLYQTRLGLTPVSLSDYVGTVTLPAKGDNATP